MDNKYYDVLDVDKNADKQQIKVAYRAKARMFHPDLNRDPGSAELFKIVQEAYEILSDDEKRKEYDKLLESRKPKKSVSQERQKSRTAQAQATYSEPIEDVYDEQEATEQIVITRLSKRWLARKILMVLMLIIVPTIIWIMYRDFLIIIAYYVIITLIDTYYFYIQTAADIGLAVWLVTSIVDKNLIHVIISLVLLVLLNVISYILGWELNIFK